MTCPDFDNLEFHILM